VHKGEVYGTRFARILTRVLTKGITKASELQSEIAEVVRASATYLI
jgi:hypothetical protein